MANTRQEKSSVKVAISLKTNNNTDHTSFSEASRCILAIYGKGRFIDCGLLRLISGVTNGHLRDHRRNYPSDA
jgi:hypothetical protein